MTRPRLSLSPMPAALSLLLALSLALPVFLLPLPADAQDGRLRDAIRERLQDRRAERGAGGPSAEELGLTRVALSHGGRDRSYLVDPKTLGNGRPVVLVFHGGEGDGTRAALASGMSDDAQARGFAVVYPNAPGQQWNDGRATTASGIDDVGYTRAVLDDLSRRFDLDTRRAYAAGISNGGMFVQRLACDAPDLFRAYAVVAANMPAELAATCAVRRAQPMIFFNGTEDRLMPASGGEIASLKALGLGVGGRVLSLAETRAFWSGRNRCDGPEAGPVIDRVTDQTKLQVLRYDCPRRVALQFNVIEGGGHNWPGSSVGGGSRLAGNVSREVDATSASLDFFARYGL